MSTDEFQSIKNKMPTEANKKSTDFITFRGLLVDYLGDLEDDLDSIVTELENDEESRADFVEAGLEDFLTKETITSHLTFLVKDRYLRLKDKAYSRIKAYNTEEQINTFLVERGNIENILERTKNYSKNLISINTQSKNKILASFAHNLNTNRAEICTANQKDIDNSADVSDSLRERLTFQNAQIDSTIVAINQIIDLPDPIGEINHLQTMPSGIRVGKMRIPLGVLLMIYESRPNVTADAASLAIKSGNAIFLRGGSEAKYSNSAIYASLQQALKEHNASDMVYVLDNYNRDIVSYLLGRDDIFDMIIPRGGRQLIERVCNETKIPVLKHLDGNCHVYIDADADIDMALDIVVNSKTRRYAVCNAAESLLVHTDIANAILPRLATVLQNKGVMLRGCTDTCALLNKHSITIDTASDEDWQTEYLSPIISVKIVPSLCQAITHINTFGSGHTDAIVTNNSQQSWRFLREVDSSSVIMNASTGFADGGEYGLGSEIGISTNRLHARGPVGIKGLTTEKYIVLGNGECR